MIPADAEAHALVQAAFRIEGQSTSQLLARAIGLFAQQDLDISGVSAARIDAGMVIEITVPAIETARARIAAERMRAFVLVDRVDLTIAGRYVTDPGAVP